MSDVSWWERALGGARRSPAPSPHQPPPQPAGYPQKAVRWQPQYPPTSPRQEVTEWDQPGGEPDDNWHKVNRQGFVEKAPGSTGTSGRCPRCNGSSFFRRKTGQFEAAPLCVDCGYNGDLFEQSGTMLNTIGMKSSGPTQFARSDNPRGEQHFEIDASLAGNADFSWNNVR
jgi:hypothetical protein